MESVEKAIILGSSKQPKRSIYELKKDMDTINFIDSFLNDLEIDLDYENSIKLMLSDNGKQEIVLKDHIDEYYDYVGDKYVVIIFIGLNKIILLVTYKSDRQQEVADILYKYADFEVSEK